MNEGMQNLKEIEDLENKFENDKQLYQLTQGITRIANYMEEIDKQNEPGWRARYENK